MKQASDKFTLDAFDSPRRGRPAKPDAKSNAQRQREWRQRQKFNFLADRNGNSSGA